MRKKIVVFILFSFICIVKKKKIKFRISNFEFRISNFKIQKFKNSKKKKKKKKKKEKNINNNLIKRRRGKRRGEENIKQIRVRIKI